MIWLSVKRDFFTGTSSKKTTRKFHFSPLLIHGGITLPVAPPDSPQPPAQQELFAVELTWFHVLKSLVVGGALRQMGPYGSAVYLAIKSYTNLQTGRAFPSIETIAKDTGISTRHVQRAISTLKELGILRADRVGRRNEYQFREQIPLINGGGEKTALASFDYSPKLLQSVLHELKAALSAANVPTQTLSNVNILINVIQANDHATVEVQSTPSPTRKRNTPREAKSAGEVLEGLLKKGLLKRPKGSA